MRQAQGTRAISGSTQLPITMTTRMANAANDMRGAPIRPYGFLRHGSEEHGSASRRSTVLTRSVSVHHRRPRSRDRNDDPGIRLGPAGVQERTDWLHALEDLEERVRTIESTQRNHAQSIAGNTSLIDQWQNKFCVLDENIVKYKAYISEQLFTAHEWSQCAGKLSHQTTMVL